MEQQPNKEIVRFLQDNIEPLENSAYGLGYRASVFLIDGTFLPCVIFRNPRNIVNLAIRRFKEELSEKSISSRSSGFGYYDIVKIL
ncbi:MAG: hypothetical protein LBK60_03265 [Verrucomicrobiales bacterium]|nr:hypothetical protein [Verrucomicrobiales bacterium]